MSDKVSKPIRDHTGHRDRVRYRILRHGASTLQDYEILEALLFYIERRRDTKDLAKTLLNEFKTIRNVLKAAPDDLRRFSGIGDHAVVLFTLIDDMIKRSAKEDAFKAPLLQSWQHVIDDCRETIGYKKTEYFMVIYLDAKNRLILAEEPKSGTVDRVAIYPREIVKTATQRNATSVILVHNHPSGDTTPSRQDIEMTKSIRDALATIQVKVHDHLIISPTEHASFKNLGLL